MLPIARNSVLIATLGILAVGTVAASADPSDTPYTDKSGLRVLTALPVDPIPDSLRDAYGTAQRLSEEHPDDFGFPTVRGERIVLPLVSDSVRNSAPQTDDALERLTDVVKSVDADTGNAAISEDKQLEANDPSIPELAEHVDLVTGKMSRTQIEAAKNDVFDLAIAPKYDDANAWQTEVDITSGKVTLRAEQLTSSLAEAIVAEFGTDTVQIFMGPRPESNPQANRDSDTSPFYGGAWISTASYGHCTDAFSWHSGSTDMMLTAGHCLNVGGGSSTPAQSMGSTTASSRENWKNGTGTTYLTGQSVYRGDIALITLNSSRTSTYRMYRGASGSSSSAVVSEMWSRAAQPGDQYCTGGSVSGEICGWTVDAADVNHEYSNGEVVRSAVESTHRTGWCVRPGDSGGRVYTVKADGTIAAKGIHSGGGGGGSDYYDGANDKCFEVFTDIYDAYAAFPGVLTTQ